nr:hypothetical protein [Tanacetum cinerariifolium]
MNISTSGISPDVAELKDMVKALLLDKKSQNLAPATVKAVEESYDGAWLEKIERRRWVMWVTGWRWTGGDGGGVVVAVVVGLKVVAVRGGEWHSGLSRSGGGECFVAQPEF